MLFAYVETMLAYKNDNSQSVIHKRQRLAMAAANHGLWIVNCGLAYMFIPPSTWMTWPEM